MITILFVYQKHFLICSFQMMMKGLILKVTIFYGRTIQVTKKEAVFVCILRNTFLLLKRDNLRTLKECLVTEIIVDKKSSFCVCVSRYHQVRLKMNLRSYIMT